jgi:ABC-type uncharacterized transport system substrate-binding protein
MKKVLILFIFINFFILYAKENILILNSYGEDFQWTSDEVDGILLGLKDKKEDYNIYIEYMDWQKEFGDNKYFFLKKIYFEKYQNLNPIMIITTDNIAYTMAKELRRDLFKNENLPLIFCGINGIKESFSYEEKMCAGIAEVMSVEDNINLILSLHHDLDKIYIINDGSETGVATKDEILKIKYLKNITTKIEYINMSSISSFKKKLSSLNKNSVILQGISTKYSDGTNTSYENTLKIILENSELPVYSFWTFLINKGIVGGKLLDGKENGIMAGEIALRVLDGENPEKIGVIEKDINKYFFDENILLKYNINSKIVIRNAVIINQKDSLFQKNKLVIIFSLSVIIILLLIFIIHSSLIKIYRQ